MAAQSSRIVLVSSRGRVALIRRRRGGREYWSFPGGGIKRGETPHRAARRELAEELGLDVRPGRLLAVVSGHVLFLATIDDEPPLRMRGPEVARRSRRDRYRPEWVPLDQLADLDVHPRAARPALIPLSRAALTAADGREHDRPGPPETPDRSAETTLEGTTLEGTTGAAAEEAPPTTHARRRLWLWRWRRSARQHPAA